MELTDKKVVHSVFGMGRVKSLESGRITIEFSKSIGQKEFQYPGAFEHYLKMSDSSLQGMVEQDLNKLLIRLAAEKEEEARKTLEEQESIRNERLARLKQTTKKPAQKKASKKATKKTEETTNENT